MDTNAWGPGLWKSMFMIAANFPLEIQKDNRLHLSKVKNYKIFYTNLQHVLPCKFCRISYKVFLRELPLKKFLGSRNQIMYWVYLMKNKVNNKLSLQGEQISSPPSFKQVCLKYEKSRAKCSEKTKSCKVPKVMF